MSSPSSLTWLSPMDSLTIRSEVMGDFHEPYGAVLISVIYGSFAQRDRKSGKRDYRQNAGKCKAGEKQRRRPPPKSAPYPSVSVLTRRIDGRILNLTRRRRVAKTLR